MEIDRPDTYLPICVFHGSEAQYSTRWWVNGR